MFGVYTALVKVFLRLALVFGSLSGYQMAAEYWQVKAGEVLKRGLISQKAIQESFYGRRDYFKYKDYREVIRDYENKKR